MISLYRKFSRIRLSALGKYCWFLDNFVYWFILNINLWMYNFFNGRNKIDYINLIWWEKNQWLSHSFVCLFYNLIVRVGWARLFWTIALYDVSERYLSWKGKYQYYVMSTRQCNNSWNLTHCCGRSRRDFLKLYRIEYSKTKDELHSECAAFCLDFLSDEWFFQVWTEKHVSGGQIWRIRWIRMQSVT